MAQSRSLNSVNGCLPVSSADAFESCLAVTSEKDSCCCCSSPKTMTAVPAKKTASKTALSFILNSSDLSTYNEVPLLRAGKLLPRMSYIVFVFFFLSRSLDKCMQTERQHVTVRCSSSSSTSVEGLFPTKDSLATYEDQTSHPIKTLAAASVYVCAYNASTTTTTTTFAP